MTFGADGTTHRSIHHTARHAHLKTRDYSADDPAAIKRSTRLLGVHPALDGSSEQSVKEWKEVLTDIANIYNQSPLAKRDGNLLRVIDIFIKLSGMHSDHCAKEKKDAQLMEKEKQKAIHQDLGEKEILGMPNQESLPHLIKAQEDMIKHAGGASKWEKLSALEQAEQESKMLEQLVIQLGEAAYENLSATEKRSLSLFIWVGCGCHKDLNSVQGGNAAMMDWGKANNIEGPVPLANRDNAAALKNVKKSGPLTPAEEEALLKTTRGGVKATKLAGEIFNSSSDKKGYHDTYRWWWQENVKGPFTFPDTSNNRFQTYCVAAGVLLLHLPHFIKFLEYVKQKKQNKQFNNMEKNLWSALHCTATKTELAALALYGQVISHPYFRKTRGAGNDVNMLELGPLHKKVYQHMQRIIGDPSFVLGPSASFEAGALDGEQWESPEIFAAIQKLAPELPHLSSVVVAFFGGAAETWKRFTSEFTPGGLIDEATSEERELAWMPPMNDVNEGALGAFRVLLTRQPQLTWFSYNARAMFHHNDTQAFMDTIFLPEDYKFIRAMAQKAEAKGLARKRRQEVTHHWQDKADKGIAAAEMRRKNASEIADRVAAIKMLKKAADVKGLKGMKLKDTLRAYLKWGAPIPKGITVNSPVGNIRLALSAAIDSFKAGEWRPSEYVEDETTSGEEFDLEQGESDWEEEEEEE